MLLCVLPPVQRTNSMRLKDKELVSANEGAGNNYHCYFWIKMSTQYQVPLVLLAAPCCWVQWTQLPKSFSYDYASESITHIQFRRSTKRGAEALGEVWACLTQYQVLNLLVFLQTEHRWTNPSILHRPFPRDFCIRWHRWYYGEIVQTVRLGGHNCL